MTPPRPSATERIPYPLTLTNIFQNKKSVRFEISKKQKRLDKPKRTVYN